jgi:ribonuclease D
MIATDSGLKELAEQIGRSPSFGLDLEFQRERTYFARLCLIQVSFRAEREEQLAIVDPLKVRDLKPLFDLVADPEIETIVHSGSQDMEIVYQQGNVVPRNIFDTQIAAALVGFGEQPGYATLVDRIMGVKLGKLETITDWSRRPLTSGQEAYALDDVRYLLELRLQLGRKLETLGRVDWAREEMLHYEEEGTYERDLQRLYLRLPRTRALSRRGLAVLRDLAVWREKEAMARNEPRGRVVSDDVLLELARRVPRHIPDLTILRGLHPMEIKRSGNAIIETVAQAMRLPESEWPMPQFQRTDDPEVSLSVDLLEVWLRSRAAEMEIGPSYLGTRHDMAMLYAWAQGEPAGEEIIHLLTGWRREIVGDDLVDIAQGKASLHLEPASRRVVLTRRSA